MDNKNHSTDELPVRFPGSLSLKDLITLISVAVSLTIAWGVFGTRLTLIESQMSLHQDADAKVEAKVDAIEKRTNAVEQQLRENEFMVDQLYEYSGKPQPKRRAPY